MSVELEMVAVNRCVTTRSAATCATVERVMKENQTILMDVRVCSFCCFCASFLRTARLTGKYNSLLTVLVLRFHDSLCFRRERVLG